MINASNMLQALDGVEPGATVFVSYLAGRAPTARAVREARKAEDEGYPKRWFLGTLTTKGVNRRGEAYITVFTETRYNDDEPAAQGHYRSFNPSLGTMLSIEVVR